MLQPPKPATLKKYGLSLEEWQGYADRQGGVCRVCKNLPTSERLCIDHFHVKGWKKMPPEQRKLWVRCLLCWTCNHYFMGRGITIERSKNVTAALEEFESRRPEIWVKPKKIKTKK